MSLSKESLGVVLIFALVVATIFLRLLPLPPNFSPVIAVALFAGAQLKNTHWAAVAALVAMLVSDFILGFHGLMVFVYASIALCAVLGRVFFKKFSYSAAITGSFAGSLLFFLITNAGVWMSSAHYAPGFEGLLQSYIAGLPFFHNSLISSLIFTVVIFKIWQVIASRYQLANSAGTLVKN